MLHKTFASIAPYTLEETYEVLMRLRVSDFDDLRGELATCCLCGVLRADGRKKAASIFNDICAAIISDKLERRHPHVFGELADNSEEGQFAEQIKTGRARAKSAAFRAGRYSAQLTGP